MTLRERIAFLNRLQQQRGFKIVASICVAVLALAALITVAVSAHAPSARPDTGAVTTEHAEEANASTPAAPATNDPKGPIADPQAAASSVDSSEDAADAIIRNIQRGRHDSTGIYVAITLTAAVAWIVIWLGLAFTYLALVVAAGVVLAPMALWGGRSATPWIIGVIGLVGLLASFSALMQLGKILLAGPGPVFAVAKNVLAEATRAKLSLIFIVLLIFGMALLPQLLDPNQPLRYRVQTFIQSSTAGSFWIIAILILIFSISTVAFEQRDKIIWQTMTKPVAHWQYLLGKWIGVTTLGLILLAVSGTGVFIFTNYLRSQPAIGETKAYETAGGGLTDDRLILETQILTARASRQPDDPEFDEKVLRENIDLRVDSELQRLGDLHEDPAVAANRREALVDKMRVDLVKTLKLSYRSIEPGGTRDYYFSGLQAARDMNLPVQLRIKPSAGSNLPDQIYNITIEIAGSYPVVRQVGLGQFYSFPLLPTCIDKDGGVAMRIQNGAVQLRGNETVVIPNPETVSFGADGIEISFTAGSFTSNFLRAYTALAIKLAFLAMVAIFSSTFLSFPVASLVSFGVFLSAEGANFLKSAVDNFATEDQQGKVLIFNTITSKITQAVANVFSVYSNLRPTARLVDGTRLSWGQMTTGLLVLSVGIVVLYFAACVIFRRRELATYSGQ